MDKIIGLLTLSFGITALGIVVSRRADTANVITAITTGVSNLQKTAVSAIN